MGSPSGGPPTSTGRSHTDRMSRRYGFGRVRAPSPSDTWWGRSVMDSDQMLL